MALALKTSTSSVRGKMWKIRTADARAVEAIRQQQNLPEIVAHILATRGVKPEEAEKFLSPKLKDHLPDPLCMKDMDKAVARLVAAIERKEKIAVFGDYDVDGATAAAEIHRYFSALGQEVRIYIPDRIAEGYGPNEQAMQKLAAEGVRLVVTVDCGTSAHAALAIARQAGMEVIVIDHHLATETLPEAVAVVNPNRLDCSSGLGYLSAAGVTFLLLVALNRALRENGLFREQNEPDLLSLLDMVALGSVCDVMELRGVNRSYVAQGLRVLRNRNNLGLTKLLEVGGWNAPPSVYTLGFVLGPRINAGGRIGDAGLGARLLTTQSEEEAVAIAAQLHKLNAERQAIEVQMLDEARAMAEKQQNMPVIFVAKEGWHPGVIGIVAGRLKEEIHKPVAVVAMEKDVGKASARSITGVDFGTAVTRARLEGQLLAGGGHAMAAGFTIEAAKLDAFHAYLCEALGLAVEEARREKILWCDGVVNAAGLTVSLAEMLERAGPYGVGNPEPRLIVSDAMCYQANVVGGKHVACRIGPSGLTKVGNAWVKGIAFRAAGTPLGEVLMSAKGPLQLAGTLKINHWNGNQYPEFQIEDVNLS